MANVTVESGETKVTLVMNEGQAKVIRKMLTITSGSIEVCQLITAFDKAGINYMSVSDMKVHANNDVITVQ